MGYEYRVMHVLDLSPGSIEAEFERMNRDFGWRFVAWHPTILGIAIYEREIDGASK